jgi:hypothetical protein
MVECIYRSQIFYASLQRQIATLLRSEWLDLCLQRKELEDQLQKVEAENLAGQLGHKQTFAYITASITKQQKPPPNNKPPPT